jgi:hypothetical protein
VNGSEPKLNDCGCCEGVEQLTPADLFNPPGLTALAYRVGTHSGFKQSMQVDLSGAAELRGLKTRRDDDPTIGLLDAWATTLDVLTFYQERIANDGYLRTATERRSLLELARAIGYELRPGVAAGTFLAFTMETAPGAPLQVSLPTGIKAQSVPEQGQQAQIFETVEEIVARPDWNKLRPRLSKPQELSIQGDKLYYKGTTIEVSWLYFNGTSTGLVPGDLVLVTIGQETSTQALTKRVLSVTPDVDAKRTKVEIESTPHPADIFHFNLPIGSIFAGLFFAHPPPAAFDLISFAPNASPIPFNDQNIREQVLSRRLRERDVATFLELNKWQAQDLIKFVTKIADEPVADQSVFAFREHAGFFGNNAPPYGSLRNKHDQPLFVDDWDSPGWKIWDAYPNQTKSPGSSIAGSFAGKITGALGLFSASTSAISPVNWPTFGPFYPGWADQESADAFLERTISGIALGSWAVFSVVDDRRVYQIANINERSLVAFAMSGKATGLSLKNPDGLTPDKPDTFQVRKTTAFVKSEKLELAALPITDAIGPNTTTLTLDNMVLGLQPGQLVVLSGEQKDAPGVTQSELLEVQDVIHFDGHSTILFAQPGTSSGLRYSYVRKTVTLNANVARATHGETKQEVIGSGNASTVWQKFNLKQSPLTYVTAPTPSGCASTLELRVNDVLWDEAPSFYQLSSQDRKYVLRRDDNSKSTVETGNWITGAGLPSGVENITAKYRVGSGLGGMVKAGQISLLLSRPAGLKEVTNPLAASGGADAENRDQARENAPVTVLTLDRIVSLQDYEDFARAYPGIGKAQAVWLWDGENKIVHITIAGADGNAVPATSDFYRNLRLSIKAASDPGHVVRIDSFEPLSFNVQARLVITRGYLATKVIEQVSEAVRSAFSFGKRSFGQAVTRSELEAVMQEVVGVDAVVLDKFHFSSKPQTCEPRLPARTSRWNNAHNLILAAELLLVNPREIQLIETQP